MITLTFGLLAFILFIVVAVVSFVLRVAVKLTFSLIWPVIGFAALLAIARLLFPLFLII